VDARRRELVLEDPGRVREGGIDVTALRLTDVALVVRVRPDRPRPAALEIPVGRGLGMEHRRVRA